MRSHPCIVEKRLSDLEDFHIEDTGQTIDQDDDGQYPLVSDAKIPDMKEDEYGQYATDEFMAIHEPYGKALTGETPQPETPLLQYEGKERDATELLIQRIFLYLGEPFPLVTHAEPSRHEQQGKKTEYGISLGIDQRRYALGRRGLNGLAHLSAFSSSTKVVKRAVMVCFELRDAIRSMNLSTEGK